MIYWHHFSTVVLVLLHASSCQLQPHTDRKAIRVAKESNCAKDIAPSPHGPPPIDCMASYFIQERALLHFHLYFANTETYKILCNTLGKFDGIVSCIMTSLKGDQQVLRRDSLCVCTLKRKSQKNDGCIFISPSVLRWALTQLPVCPIPIGKYGTKDL